MGVIAFRPTEKALERIKATMKEKRLDRSKAINFLCEVEPATEAATSPPQIIVVRDRTYREAWDIGMKFIGVERVNGELLIDGAP